MAEALLDALSYLHAQGIIHRDVKDDNVIVSASANEVTLIDLGVCKGDGRPNEGRTFLHVGSTRFSPPSKLKNPANANPVHDVFAVGVLCYLLLTNQHPWSVDEGQDIGHLENVMRNEPHVPIRDRNKIVEKRAAELIDRLLETDDAKRPSADEALKEFAEYRQSIESRAAPSVLTNVGALRLTRVLRDPLHGDILLTNFEFRLINCREFQRLRRIRQLGLSNLVFPGAEHSRFLHAAGTMHVAETILSRIEAQSGTRFDPDERLTARVFALIHDLGHIPFGHTLEDELSLFKGHDRNRERVTRLLTKSDSEIGPILESTEYGRAAIDLLDNDQPAPAFTWINELVSSAVGADVIDYIDRDSLFCGLDHRVDSAILRNYMIERNTTPNSHRHLVAKLYGRHGFRVDADYAIVSLLRERFGLFLKVYTHFAKVAAGAS